MEIIYMGQGVSQRPWLYGNEAHIASHKDDHVDVHRASHVMVVQRTTLTVAEMAMILWQVPWTVLRR